MRLNLVALHVSDLSASLEIYRRLGMEFQQEQHGAGPVHYSSQANGLTFELYPAARAGESVRIGFAVKSFEPILAALDPAHVLSAPKASPWGRRMVLLDPDRNRVELIEDEVA